jgi:hypothetical protein
MTTKTNNTFCGMVQALQRALKEFWEWFVVTLRITRKQPTELIVEAPKLDLHYITVPIDWRKEKQRLLSMISKLIKKRKRAKRLTYIKSRSQKKNARKWGRKR